MRHLLSTTLGAFLVYDTLLNTFDKVPYITFQDDPQGNEQCAAFPHIIVNPIVLNNKYSHAFRDNMAYQQTLRDIDVDVHEGKYE